MSKVVPSMYSKLSRHPRSSDSGVEALRELPDLDRRAPRACLPAPNSRDRAEQYRWEAVGEADPDVTSRELRKLSRRITCKRVAFQIRSQGLPSIYIFFFFFFSPGAW